MVLKLTEQQISDLKTSFDAFDRNSDNTINRRELHALLHTVGHKVNASGLEDLLTKYDVDKNGSIDFDEFIELTDKLIKHKVSQA
ncbi:hypothetical protein CPC16_000089 [Podila verticillata]|nr:hypothetical protein BGZ59_009794 [Podila verticillata]KAF9394124.1 hypothetical protein CPC16_000089 [Podila verticillata]KFH71040.1 hypothetical protein MVEG_03886 [Podila verticillata NRRL 6337]